MSGQLRAEVLKQRSTQTTLFLFLAMVGLVALASALHVLAPSPSSLASHSHQLEVFEGGTAAAALWATIGLGIGALVRNQVATLIGLCAWILLIENLLQFVPGVARYAPGAAGLALAGRPDELPAAAGVLVLVLYALAASAGGWLATLRRDVA